MSNLGTNENAAAATSPRQVQLTVSGVQNDLKNGLSRPMIQAKYALSGKDLKDLFSHPSLKGLKTKSAPGFVLFDDTVEGTQTPEVSQISTPTIVEVEAEVEIEMIEEYETEEVSNSTEMRRESEELESWEQDLAESDSVL